MPFGQKATSLKQLKKNLKKGSGSFIQFIPKEGSLTVRFLQEPEEWVAFTEVYDPTLRRGYPLPEEGMPGYDDDLRRSSRYLCNALDVENDKVIPLQLPKTLVNQLVVRYEKYDTICDRDYELIRDGEGKETTYMASPESPSARKVTKYMNQLIDLEKALEDAYNNVFGGDDTEEDEDDQPVVRKKTKRPPAKTVVTPQRKRRRRVVQDDDEEPF